MPVKRQVRENNLYGIIRFISAENLCYKLGIYQAVKP